jgi:hypothetical protein
VAKALAVLLFSSMLLGLLAGSSFASYTVTYLNTTIALNTNTSATVTEVLTVRVSNSSVDQYLTDRIALNFTLSTWQQLIGPELVQHVINPNSGIYNFKFTPGPLIHNYNGGIAYMVMSYVVNNATTVQRTSPRTFVYTFNPYIFNFEHAASGELLPQNTTLAIVVPKGSRIEGVYPIPDVPATALTTNYANVTTLMWLTGEPLSKFALSFSLSESLSQEVTGFFGAVYGALGIFTYVIVALIIIVIIAYTYIKAGR